MYGRYRHSVGSFGGDYYPRQLGNHVLGVAFYATRLYLDLRENAGPVYHVPPTASPPGGCPVRWRACPSMNLSGPAVVIWI